MLAPRPWHQDLLVAWRPLPRVGGADWAERFRVLGVEESAAAPGPFRCVPWQREILDALADPLLEWIVILKAAQMGASELIRCAIGRWALLDPGDVLWVVTTEAAAKKAMKKLQAMFRNTPALRPLLTNRKRDKTLLELVLTSGMRIVIGWAGSAQSLASDPFRYVILDEAAKYKWSVQGEGSPVDLAKERTKTLGRRGKIVLLSSPAHPDDIICTAYRETPDRRTMRVPCPICYHLQPAEFDRVRWPGGEPDRAPSDPDERVRLAGQLEREQGAWMACVDPACPGRIHPERGQHDPAARWDQEEPIAGERRRAYHVPELFHWQTSLSDLAAKFLRATHPNSQNAFSCGSLGRPHRDVQTIEGASLAARAIHPAGFVPEWASTVLATADTQLAGWWLMVRAWGKGNRSRLLWWGFVETEEQLLERGLHARFPVEGGGEAEIAALAIDTGGGMEMQDGSRTDQVYKLVRRTPRVHALKGERDREATDPPSRKSKVSSPKAKDIELHLVNKTFYADMLAQLIRALPILWEECQGADDPRYTRQMSAEHKVKITGPKGTEWRWVKKSTGAANHLYDCARYQCWLAEFTRVEARERPAWQRPKVSSVRVASEREEGSGWLIGRGD